MRTRVRCAIYTRKSSEDGLEQEFNSLDAQREACAAYIKSQKAEGWVLLPDRYDDGGLSGGTLDRPGLQQLLRDIDAGRVDRIVVYKIDRLTRSLADFARIVDRLDSAEASFVSVTQSFNTATSMGRLTLNMLLSFAQFEREVTAERIRDKLAASKRKGLWMGGYVPMGYRQNGRTLLIDETEADVIRTLYALYEEHRSIVAVRDRAAELQLLSKERKRSNGTVTGGRPFGGGHIHHILTNPIYAGRIRHKNKMFDGQHPAIIVPERWDSFQQMLADAAGRARGKQSAAHRSPLAGKVFDETGDRLTPSHSKKNGRRLRYYISRRLVEDRSRNHPDAWRLPAPQLEGAVVAAIRSWAGKTDAAVQLLQNAWAAEIDELSGGMKNLAQTDDRSLDWHLVSRIDLRPGHMRVALDRQNLAGRLAIEPDRLRDDALLISVPFRQRRRGVETRIIVGDAPAEIDQTLIRNIVQARTWYADICNGSSYAEIAARDGTSRRRVQDIVGLAFLSPDLLKQVVAGAQPAGLTTDFLIKTGFSANWAEQHAAFAELD